jgi:pimeloyl-ACP methyl ester carboxylesterase
MIPGLEHLSIGPRDGPTLVFLHEGLGSVSAWRDFPARLAAATGLGAFVYSRRGYGRSDPLPGPFTTSFMHEEARALPAILEAASVRDPILVGHSDGASIALLHAALHPVRGLALEAPHVFVEDVCLASIAALRERFPELRARFEKHHGANTDAVFRAWTDAWLHKDFRAWNIEAALPAIRSPLLVIQGDADEYGTLAQVRALETHLTGRVETLVLPHCGHSPHRDAPEAVLEAMTRFVRSVL